MKKNILFSLLAVLVAWFWFGGISMAACDSTEIWENEVSLTHNEWTTYCSLTEAISSSENWDTVTLLTDVTVSSPIMISKSITLDWDNHTINTSWNRWIRIDQSDVNVEISNLHLIWNSNTQRWIQVDSDKTNVTLIIDNVIIEWITYYAINICGWVSVKLTISDSTINWWAALNVYWHDNEINIIDSTLRGINDKSESEWNTFSTINLEWDTTYETTDHSRNYTINIENSSIIAESQNSNKQYAIWFNSQSSSDNLTIKWSDNTVIYPNWYFYYDDWTDNTLTIEWGNFSNDLPADLLSESICSIKNAEWTFDVVTCPETTEFDMSSNLNITIPVVLNSDGNWLLLNETIAVLNKAWLTAWDLYTMLTSETTTQDLLNEYAKVETVEWQKLLFFKQPKSESVYKIWVFTEKLESDGPFSTKDKFIGGDAYNEWDIIFDTSAKKDPFNISNWTFNRKYKEVGNFWYTLYAEEAEENWNEWWFYAPRLYTITKWATTNWTITVAESAKVWDEVTLTATPASNYNFWAWTVKDASDNTITVTNNTFTMPASNVTVTATFTAKPSAWGGSSGWSSAWSSSSSSSKTTTTNNTWSTNTWTNATSTTSNTEEINLGWKVSEESTTATEETATPDNGYSKEFNDAYTWAFKNGITTMDSIEKADMNAPLTRIAMAKMLSQYAINVLGKTPDTTKVVPNFPDVSAELDAQYNSWVTLAYQLGIMWLNIDNFRPNDLVTRAEFGTALSRMLYGLADGEWAYYETHLAKLMEEKIITVDTPDLQELRWYVMIMLMRSANI